MQSLYINVVIINSSNKKKTITISSYVDNKSPHSTHRGGRALIEGRHEDGGAAEHARELGGAHKLVQPEDPVPDALRSRL